eukprot:gene57973-biopygen44327
MYPAALHLRSPNGQQECSGRYVLVDGERPNGHPLWKHDALGVPETLPWKCSPGDAKDNCVSGGAFLEERFWRSVSERALKRS